MSKKKEKVLIVDDNEEFRSALAEAIVGDFDVVLAATLQQASYLLGKGVDVAVLDVRLKEEDAANREGLDLLKEIVSSFPNIPVVVMTNHADIDMAVEAMVLGACDFVQKAFLNPREFLKRLHDAIKNSRTERKVTSLEADNKRLAPWDMVGADPKILEIQNLIDSVAEDGYATVLIRGETGTGKELVARAIHSRGWRKSAPFVPVTVPLLPNDLIESALFGHTRGAFTGAVETRMGFFETAQGGVCFLDEIGDLSFEGQIKLLRFLEERTITRVGSTQEIKLDVQIVAATNKNLEEAIQQGKFRDDLYFRLKTVEINVPPLRQRVNDIPLLSEHFLFLLRQQGRTKVGGFNQDALHQLKNYPFRGNIRELKNLVYNLMVSANTKGHEFIELEDLPQEIYNSDFSLRIPDLSHETIDLDEELAKTELSYIQKALQLTDGRKTEAWKVLGLNDRFSLRRRVKTIGETYPDLIKKFPFVQKLYYE